MAWFDDPRHSSAKLTAMLESVSHIRGAVGDVLGLYLDTACNLLFAITLAFVFSWRTALLVLGVLPLLVAGTVLFHRAASSGACMPCMISACPAETHTPLAHAFVLA